MRSKDLKKTDILKQKIVATAIEEFARNGYAETSIKAIAAASDIGQTALLFHFKSKLNLFTEAVYSIVASNVEMFAKGIKDEDDGRARLVTYFKINARWAVEMPHHAEIMTTVYHFGMQAMV